MITKAVIRKVAQHVDEAIVEHQSRLDPLQARLDRQVRAAKGAAQRGDARAEEHFTKRADAIEVEMDEIRVQLRPLYEIADAGNWSRYVVVPGGHVHRPECSTLYPRTVRFWLPSFSGADEAELVEAAGDHACTVCFPSAPTNRPTTIPLLVEEREAREAEAREKAQKRAQARTEAILDEDGNVEYKTQRAAENALSQEIKSALSYASYYAVQGGIYGIPEAPNPESHEEQLARLDKFIQTHLEGARRIVGLLQARGVETEPIVARKLAAAIKAENKNGAIVPEGFSL
ncbi:hypothetical protein SEA_VROOMVROOM_49 [Arthrobacter phage VroomVroom]|uniref:Uncharacterized protein n=1 Tax=Arthrobacter phage VroomVroom TaxID=3049371 RepID=A0AA49FAE1_9CAUD|nr:hypothetical protein SEA_VROOMVROOM_49 [Arthrobacter phage VroomVroom]